MVHVTSLVTLMCLVLAVDGKIIGEDGSRTNVTTRNEEETRKFEIISRSPVIANSSNYQPPKNSSSKTREGGGLCSGEKDQRRCLVSALSRIARIQVDEDRDSRNGKKSYDDLYDKKDQEHRSQGERRNELGSANESRGTCHCNALRDVYVPEIGKELPAYACRFHDRIFVLTSERFLEDRRSYFDIDVDEETSRRLLVTGSKQPRTVRTEILPVTLVLKIGEDNYRIRKKSYRGKNED
ncbi:hypothetical protein KPH14_009752 [Odynerus spinipes]|uniref:Uncharacterized protein n=1 Tax=Odynerus spinipes TaxID=1348599 RepID=A0AAD9RFT4_9HYME|nr:hypothetical protein KPH14_009752 [Odynerus spinipes]